MSGAPCYPRPKLHRVVTLTHHLSEHPAGLRRRSRRLAAAAVAGIAITALVAWGVTQIDLASVGAALGDADPRLLAAAVALYLVGQTISGAMWAVCQSAGGVHRLPLATALGMHWVSRAACELLPASLGEGARVALVRRHPAGARAGGWRIAGGLAGYKVIDAAVTGAAVLAVALIVPLPGPAGGLRWTALGSVVAVGVAALVWRLVPRRPSTGPGRVRRAAARLGEGAGVLGHGPSARTATGLGVIALIARVLSLCALLAALGAPPQAAPLAFSVIVLAGVVPAAPGGAGTRELLLVPALVLAYGMTSADALAFSLAVQATALACSLVAGLAALAWLVGGPLTGRGGDLAVEPLMVERLRP